MSRITSSGWLFRPTALVAGPSVRRLLLALTLILVSTTRASAQAPYDASNGGGTGLPVGASMSNVQLYYCSYYFTPMAPYTQCIYNDFGRPVSSISRATPFTFQGGFFEASRTYSPAPTTLDFIGTDAANTTYRSSCPLTLDAFVFCSFIGSGDFTDTPIVSLDLVTSGGRDVYNEGDGGYYVGNALSFDAPVVATPEPGSVALIATGLLGLCAARRRRV